MRISSVPSLALLYHWLLWPPLNQTVSTQEGRDLIGKSFPCPTGCVQMCACLHFINSFQNQLTVFRHWPLKLFNVAVRSFHQQRGISRVIYRPQSQFQSDYRERLGQRFHRIFYYINIHGGIHWWVSTFHSVGWKCFLFVLMLSKCGYYMLVWSTK